MLRKLIANELAHHIKAFKKIPFTQGGVIEIDDYLLAPEEKHQAKLLTKLVHQHRSENKLPYIWETDYVWDLYHQSPNIDTSVNKKITWLLYGGVLNFCIRKTIYNIIKDKKDLSKDSVTWIGLPLFAINKAYSTFNGEMFRYPREATFAKDLAQGSYVDHKTGYGYLSTSEDNELEGMSHCYFYMGYPAEKRILIRQDGKLLKLLNPKGGPTFVLDFYSSWASLFANAFKE